MERLHEVGAGVSAYSRSLVGRVDRYLTQTIEGVGENLA